MVERVSTWEKNDFGTLRVGYSRIYSNMSHSLMVSYIGWGVLSESGENTIVTYIPDMEEYQAYTIVGLTTGVLIEITRTEGRS